MKLAEKTIDQYPTVLDIFTRKLKPGIRPIQSVVVSPADGRLTNSDVCKNDLAVQFKQMTYSASELVFAGTEATVDLTWFFTVYLSPMDYHRVHSPVSGKMVGIRYVPGALFAVNATFASLVPNLFSKNERMIFEIELDQQAGRVFVVMIGALNVGAIRCSHFPDLISNDWQRQIGRDMEYRELSPAIDVQAGDELGTFLLGSTAVVLFDEQAVKSLPAISKVSQSRSIEMGCSLLS